MHYLNTEMALVGVNNRAISSHQSGCKTKSTKTKYQKENIWENSTAKIFGATLVVVALAVGGIQYKEDRTNVNFDITRVGVGLQENITSIKDVRASYITGNISKLEEISNRNSLVANNIINSMNTVESTVTASSYVKVSPNEMVDVSEIGNGQSNQAAGNEASTIVKEEVPGPLLDIANPDLNYTGQILNMSGQNRANLESLVFNEAGDQGFIGACLVAQAIRDQMVESGIRDASTIKRKYGYEAAINGRTNETAKQAVSYIFDHGGMAVQHRIIYFYAPRLVKSSWHESQNFVVEYKGHRVFDRR